MSVILKQPITGPAAWKGRDLVHDDSWIQPLSPGAIDTLDAALRQVKAKGLRFPHFTKQDFPIGALEHEFRRHAETLETGRGFVLIRGLPVERYSDDDIDIVYFGIGLHLGVPVQQNPQGDLLGRVMNVGDPGNKDTRVYETNANLPYHTDPSDVFGLLCVRKAIRGGCSSLVSAASVYNELLDKHPEYLGLLYRPTWYAHLGEDLPSLSPIFSWHDGKLSCRYLRQYIELGGEVRGLPLSRVEIEAFDCFDAISHDPDLRLDMMLEPGDLQFANNYVVMHSRTPFEDADDPARRRKLLRLWLKMPNARSLAADFPGRNGFSAELPAAS